MSCACVARSGLKHKSFQFALLTWNWLRFVKLALLCCSMLLVVVALQYLEAWMWLCMWCYFVWVLISMPLCLPMSSSLNDISSPCKNKVEGRVTALRPIGCVCKYQVTKKSSTSLSFIYFDGLMRSCLICTCRKICSCSPSSCRNEKPPS